MARLLERIAGLLSAQQASPFRARAYHDAAVQLRELRQPLRQILEERGCAGLEELPAVGPSIASAIAEYLTSGHLHLLSRLEGRSAPEDVFTTLPGIGEELAQRLHETLGVETLEELELAAHDGRLQRVPGFGPRRTLALRDLLAARLSRALRRHAIASDTTASLEPALELPDVATLLGVDAAYREGAAHGTLHRMAPARFNPQAEEWLPILHAEHDGWHFTALFSNSARAHELHKTRDWVVIHYARHGRDGQCTVVTEWHGSLEGRRVVRGREGECSHHYEPVAEVQHTLVEDTERWLEQHADWADARAPLAGEAHADVPQEPRQPGSGKI
ncbi:MAG TPA: helix-hairpin-helix domain-containing protein [Polyangiaceae bacterium]|nr:helix-hairpin-helix domain-containing protein [Polyangiaceae bacterium]